MDRQQLEQAALDGHARGQGWMDFHLQHGAAISAAEPDPVERAKLVRRLMHLLCSGERSGQFPIGDLDGLEPVPDTPSPHDVETRARYVSPPMEQATMFDTSEEYV